MPFIDLSSIKNAIGAATRPTGGANDPRWRMVDRYNRTYWSGNDCEVYFENLRMLDGLQIGFNLLERVQPYYHYSGQYTPARMQHGQRMVSGEFSINFTRSSLMHSVFQYLRSPESRQLSPESSQSVPQREIKPVIPFADEPWGPTDLSELANVSAKDIRRIVDSRKAMMASQEKDVYLGKPNSQYSPTTSPFSPLFHTGPKGFNIYIVFGGALLGGKELRFDGGDEYRTHQVSESEQAGLAIGTGIQLNGVSVMSEAMVVADDGRGAMATFTFQACDLTPMEQHLLEELSAGFTPKVDDLY